MAQSNKYYKSPSVGVTSEVDLTTDRDLAKLLSLRNTTSFIPVQHKRISRIMTEITFCKLSTLKIFFEAMVIYKMSRILTRVIVFISYDDNHNTMLRWLGFALFTFFKGMSRPTYRRTVVVLFTNPSARAGYDTRSIFKRS